MDNVRRLELTITALKQSIASKVADYEEQLASLRAEASLIIEEQNQRIAEFEKADAERVKDVSVQEEA